MGYRQTVQNGCCTGIISGLLRRHKEAQRLFVEIGNSMQLRSRTVHLKIDRIHHLDEDPYVTQHAVLINARFAMALKKKGCRRSICSSIS